MRKYLPHILIISFVFLLAPTAQVASYAGKIEDAKEEVRKNPDDAEEYFREGRSYGFLRMWEMAIVPYKQAIRIDPDYRDAHYNLGNAYYESGKYKEAIESYKQALRISPDYRDAHYNLGITYLQMNDRDSALKQYEILKELNTRVANALFDLIYKE